jgi:DNA-binding transcriptional LysR family regulator
MIPNIHGTDYAQLRAFIAIAEALSFSRAAEGLGVTPSSLSQMMRALEERLGLRLLNRTTRSVSLTPAGEALLARISPAMDEIQSALTDALHFREKPAGTVRIHSSRIPAAAYLAPHLSRFRKTYPEIVLDISVDDTVVDIVSSGFDIGLRPREVLERDLVAVQIGPELCQYPVATPAYLERRGTPQTPDELSDHDCILWRWPGRNRPYAWEFHFDGRWFEVLPKPALIVDDRQMMLRACLDSCGIAFPTNLELGLHVARGQLVQLMPQYCKEFEGYHLCYPRQRQMAPALRTFIDFIREAVRGTPPNADC